MRTLLSFLLCILAMGTRLPAQDDNVTLLAQSADGKAVKLFWHINKWNSSYTGFDIKKKEGMQNWVKLNTTPILPGISSKRKLTLSGNNLYEESLLKAKMYKLLKTRELQETDHVKYLQKLNSDPEELKEMNQKMTEDYDVAMLNGFGYMDHTCVKKTDYQYGLFIQGTDKLVAKATWNYGEIPDLDVVQELTSKASAESKGIRVFWVADSLKLKAAHVAGFNIYREGIRLNTTRITAEDITDPSLYSWLDKYVNSTNPTQYSIAAESIFNIEGIIRSYAYDPQDHPKEYRKADVTEISSVGFYFKEGTDVKWNFPKEYERFIKGFYIEKDNMPAGYTLVSGLLDPSARSYTDKTQSQVNGYIKMRVKTCYKDRTNMTGGERLYCYLPVTEPPTPEHLKFKNTPGNRQITIHLSWDAAVPGDSLTDYYKVYTFDALNNKQTLVSTQELKSPEFDYVLQHAIAGVHKFCVLAVSKAGSESPLSDTLMVPVPTVELPVPLIKSVMADNSNKATIEWQYPDIGDLKGFELMQNGKVIATAAELKKSTHSYVSGKLEEGGSYEFVLVAVSENGTRSDNSAPYHVVVAQTSK